MFEQLEKKLARHKQLQELLADHQILQDKALYAKYAREYAGLGEAADKYSKYKALLQELAKIQAIVGGKKHQDEKDFLELARQELGELEEKKTALEGELEEILLEGDEAGQSKNIIMEIRAGTGGEEAALFVADLYRMYTKYAANVGWKAELLSSRPTEMGGFKEIIFSLQGRDVFKKIKYESGVHRVQRVPLTEASGRIHTSAVSVAVMPEPEEIEIKIEPADIKVDVFRSGGHGGQSVNTTDSAVRITHLATGIVVSCQDERSQLKNKIKAMRVLRARLLDKMQEEQQSKQSLSRRSQVGTGDRSEKIRTYNFPDRRVTDHRISLTLHKLEAILNGGLDELISALLQEEKKKKLSQC